MNEQPDGVKTPAEAVISRSREEVLIPDERAELTPAQMVERKLHSMLRRCPLLVSQLQTSVRVRLN
jgi:hypothetical protein